MNINRTISFVLPVYNSADLITDALNSVLKQSFRPCEIIIIDDGSTDNLNDVLEPFQKYISVIRTHSNQGAASARNLGVEQSQGEWIAFIDADDIWHPLKLELQMKEIVKLDKGIRLISTGYFYTEMGSEKLPVFHTNIDSYLNIQLDIKAKESLVDNPYLGLPTCVVNKKLFQCIGGFRTSLKTAEDIHLNFRLAKESSILVLESKVVICRNRSNSLRTSGTYPNEISVLRELCSDSDYIPLQKLIVYRISTRTEALLRGLLFTRQLANFKKEYKKRKNDLVLHKRLWLLTKYRILNTKNQLNLFKRLE
jgi:glycosyltransferase involved in cell wall biosynthesis